MNASGFMASRSAARSAAESGRPCARVRAGSAGSSRATSAIERNLRVHMVVIVVLRFRGVAAGRVAAARDQGAGGSPSRPRERGGASRAADEWSTGGDQPQARQARGNHRDPDPGSSLAPVNFVMRHGDSPCVRAAAGAIPRPIRIWRPTIAPEIRLISSLNFYACAPLSLGPRLRCPSDCLRHAGKWVLSRGAMRRGSPEVAMRRALAAFVTILCALELISVAGSAQVVPHVIKATPPSLKTVPIPTPVGIETFVKDKAAAVALGKALFWDMQVGSDGIVACASCHFQAGADRREKNELNPGATPKFDLTGPNHTSTAADFPFHQLANPDDRGSTLLRSRDDVSGSQERR